MKMRAFLKERYPRFWRFIVRLRYPTLPVPLGLWILNWIVQRIFRINGDVPWMVHYTSYVTGPERIQIGQDVWVSFAMSGGCYIQAINGIIIGNRTLFAPGVKFISANHNPDELSQPLVTDPIEIGDDCWIGANAVILPGVKLGDRCIVGAGAVVTKSFPAGSCIVGVPGKPITRI